MGSSRGNVNGAIATRPATGMRLKLLLMSPNFILLPNTFPFVKPSFHLGTCHGIANLLFGNYNERGGQSQQKTTSRMRSRRHARWSQKRRLSGEGEWVTAMYIHLIQLLIPAVGVSPPLQSYSYPSKAKVGRQSLLMESNEAHCDSAITLMIHGLDLPLSFSSDPLFLAVLKTARTVGSEYRPPNRHIIGGALLDANYNIVRTSNEKKLTENSDITGLQAMGDSATIRKMPLFNVLASTHGTPPVVLAIHDCSKHLALSRWQERCRICCQDLHPSDQIRPQEGQV